MATEYDMVITESKAKIIEINPRSRTGRKKIIGKRLHMVNPKTQIILKSITKPKLKHLLSVQYAVAL